jgi:hypothetical protein
VARLKRAIRARKWRLLAAAPVLLIIAMSTGWVPFYAAFVLDVCALAYAYRRRDLLRRGA